LARVRGDAAEQRVLLRAAQVVREWQIESEPALQRALESPPSETESAVLRRLQQLLEAGGWVMVESAIADLPADLRWLHESRTTTAAQLALLHEKFGVTSLADLIDAVETNALRAVHGLGEAVEASVRAALPDLRRSTRRTPLGRAVALVDPLLEDIRSSPGVHWAEPAGSLRRAEETIGDVEIVVAADDPSTVASGILDAPTVDRVLHRSASRLYVLTSRSQVGIRFPEVAKAGPALLRLTGSLAHFRALQARAAERGWRLAPDGLWAPDGSLQRAATEIDVYSALDLPYIPPEIRDDDGAIAAAARGRLPRLLAWQHIRGDLHMHSVWSDGHDSIETMMRTCRNLGYEYAAVTDHSPRSGAVRSLTQQTIRHQLDEVAAVRERMPDIAILHGCEVDILPDGRLDFPDRVLQQFDIVLASLHHRAGQSSAELLRRYAEAMQHPLVTVITHPANRSVPNNPGYDLDYDRLFELAVQTNTCLEIDGAPGHLDMPSTLARRAAAAGVRVTVDSDAHSASGLARQMRLGIATACRGWVEPRHVLNTSPLAEVRALIARKRGD
jgi:DNA polymerase (family X)